MRNRFGKEGFSFIEILVITAIIGLLSSIAIPNLIASRETAIRNKCVANLKQIHGAVNMWAANTLNLTGTPDLTDLEPVYIKDWPVCENNSYGIPAANGDAVCPQEKPGHSI